MKIYNGEFEIINSGTLVSPNLGDTRFVVSEAPHMEIVFRVNMEGEKKEIHSEMLNETTLALVFTKPSGLGYGPAYPVRVGKLNGKPLYVVFRVSLRTDDSSYELEYTFYVKESE
ncbi:hypothetical protein D3C80_1555130 [compost metagenome]